MRKLFAGCLLAWAAAAAAADPLSVEQFFKRPIYSRLALSPDGTRVAAIVPGAKRDRLAVFDVDTRAARPVTNFVDADVLYFEWISDKRLVLSIGDAHEASSNAEFYGWYAVDADGSALEEIAMEHYARGNAAWTWMRYFGAHPDGGDLVIIEPHWRYGGTSLLVWDTRSAKVVRSLNGGGLRGVRRWLFDGGGVPRAARTYEDGRERVFYRGETDPSWRVLAEADEFSLPFWPLGFDAAGALYVGAYEQGRDKSAIFKYDFAHRRLGERVARHLDASMVDVVVSRRERRLLGFTYDGDHVVWVDQQFARVQGMVDRVLRDTSNAVSIAETNPNRALITAHSDVEPPRYYLFDAAKLTLVPLSSSRPWIDPKQMSERKLVTYKARDGLDIPAFLTIPKGTAGKNLPLVVEIHGGPWIDKQEFGFDLHAQFFASRGYAVLQPDFRGTLGYGKRHFEASFGQWGFAMQDDITDGVEWLIGKGIADPHRVCLVGGSYGGYAALWGLMKTPDAYRCGVAYVAPTDIAYMFSFNRWDWVGSVWMDYGAKTLIGDPDRDAEKFRSVSPVPQAERLKAPVLLAYGGADQRVPIKHGNALRAALDSYGKQYEWVVYSDEGHGFNDDKNRFDFWRRVDAFLKKHLATRDTQAASKAD